MNYSRESGPSRPVSLLAEQFLPLLLIITASFVLVGWFSGNSQWVQIQDSWPVIPILTAFNFLALGLILEIRILRSREILSDLAARIGFNVLFSWIFITTISVVLRNVFGWKLSIESFFWPEIQIQLIGHIGMVSISSAVSFILTATLLYIRYRKWNFGNILLLFNVVPLLLSFAVLIAHAYQSSDVYAFTLFKETSLVTSLLFLIFHAYWIINYTTDTSQRKGMPQDKPFYASFAVMFLSFLLLGVISSRSLVDLIGTHQSQIHAQEKIKTLQDVLVNLLNVETGGRGYVITGEKEYLEPYYLGLKNYQKNIEDLKKLSPTSEEQNSKLKQIEELAAVKVAGIEQVIEARDKQGVSTVVNSFKKRSGKQAMDEIRKLVDELSQDQLQILKLQGRYNQEHANLTLTMLVSGSIIAALLLILCFLMYRKNEIRRFNAEKEIKVLNLSLAEKLKETESLNQELESFSYSVSHDLRAPLRAMSGFGEILMEDLAPRLEKSDLDYLKRIVTASEKMSRLIDGLLVLSRLTRTQIKKTEVNLNKVVTELAADFEVADGSRKLSLQFKAGAKIWGDETLIILLLQNLVGNAWKFTSKKENPEIEVGSFEKQGHTVFYVKDNGAGFDMKYSNKLFGTFQRLHFESEFQGTGIGLATSKRIVSMHSGEIWAEAKENEGATFFFYFPANPK